MHTLKPDVTWTKCINSNWKNSYIFDYMYLLKCCMWDAFVASKTSSKMSFTALSRFRANISNVWQMCTEDFFSNFVSSSLRNPIGSSIWEKKTSDTEEICWIQAFQSTRKKLQLQSFDEDSVMFETERSNWNLTWFQGWTINYRTKQRDLYVLS